MSNTSSNFSLCLLQAISNPVKESIYSLKVMYGTLHAKYRNVFRIKIALIANELRMLFSPQYATFPLWAKRSCSQIEVPNNGQCVCPTRGLVIPRFQHLLRRYAGDS